MHVCLAQDISGFKKQKPFAWNANINLFSSSIVSDKNQYNPFAYGAALNGAISLYGIQIPLNFTYRERQASYAAPFSRFNITPSYKWIKLYLGHNQVEYNRYTLSGVPIFGIGFEINPGILRLGVLTGKANDTKFIVDTLSSNSGIVNPHQRQLTTYKVGIGSKTNYLDFILLTGKDTDKVVIEDDTLGLPLQSNTNFGISAAFAILRNRISVSVNGAASGYTNNINGEAIDKSDLDNNKLLSFANDNFTINKSTSVRFAGDGALTFHFGNFTVGGRYQRIDPFFKSFGINYLRGDHENISFQTSVTLFSGVLAVSGSYGIDRNNLYNLRLSTTKQNIYDINLQVNPLSWFGIDAQISNFNYNQNNTALNVNDTLRFVQINANQSISPYLRFGNKRLSHTINLNFTNQTLDDITNQEEVVTNSKNQSVSLGYQFRNKVRKWNLGVNLFHFGYSSAENSTSRAGINMNAGKSFLKEKLSIRLRSSVSRISANSDTKGLQVNIGPTVSYKIGRGSLLVQFNFITRPASFSLNRYNETRIYSNFSMPLK
ncbi:MAG: hypothetical protein IPN29_07270 [Saprospiraceae bacterium]|nr:hypothetical protein [Saprospiraceae bacterium]